MTVPEQIPGPWDEEPDHLDLVLSGFRCEIKRIPHGRHLCGYIVLPEFHPLRGLHYSDDLDDRLPDVHGGWTFSEDVNGAWTIGLDCAHSGDLVPDHLRFSSNYVKFALRNYRYRTIDYVRLELARAAAELASMLTAHQRIAMSREAPKVIAASA